MCRIIAVFFLFIFSLSPAHARASDYLAVFSSMDFWPRDWANYAPDIYWRASSWNEFPEFLEYTSSVAGDKAITVVVQVHGDSTLALCSNEDSKNSLRKDWDYATMGWVVSYLDRYLGDRNLTVVMEACFGGNVYKKTIRGVRPHPIVRVCNYNKIPKFPIYGVEGTVPGWNNSIYMQYNHRFRVNMVDLRTYEQMPERIRKTEKEYSQMRKDLSIIRYYMWKYGI